MKRTRAHETRVTARIDQGIEGTQLPTQAGRDSRTAGATSDHVLVEDELSERLPPAVPADCETKLPNKALSQAKLDELYEFIASERQDKDS
jgi:hypothetical protein